MQVDVEPQPIESAAVFKPEERSPPGIAVSGDASRLHVEVTSVEQGDCPAMLAVEAIGLQLAPSFAGATVEAAHLTERFGADDE